MELLTSCPSLINMSKVLTQKYILPVDLFVTNFVFKGVIKLYENLCSLLKNTLMISHESNRFIVT